VVERKGKGVVRSPIPAQIASYQRLLRNELPTAVKNELVVLIEKEISPMEERIRCQLPEIVRIVQRRLFQMFQETDQPEGSTNAQDPPHTGIAEKLSNSDDSNNSNNNNNNNNSSSSSSGNGWNETFPDHQYAMGLAAMDDQLAAYWPGPPDHLAFEDFDQFNFMPRNPQFTASERASDSGYQSTHNSAALVSSKHLGTQDNTADGNSSPETLSDRADF
jgi:hypothetical protein